MKQQKRLFQYSSYTKLKNDIKYNVCVEITIQTNDIIKKNFSQLYKNIACLKFLKTANDFLNKKKTSWKNFFGKNLEYFKNKTNFIDFKNEIVLITASNGAVDSFNQLKIELENRKKLKDEVTKIFDNINIYNYYMIYYPVYDNEGIYNLDKKVEDLQERLKILMAKIEKKENNSQQNKEEKENKEEKKDKSPKKEIRKDEEEEEYKEEEEEDD